MPQPTALEQYMLELVNAERAAAGVAPLAFDSDLNESAEIHSQWMLAADIFSHTGNGGSAPSQRMQAAGYIFNPPWGAAENIAWASIRQPDGFQNEVWLLHTNLMNSTGHRANILDGSFREIGIGFEVGVYGNIEAASVTQNFAFSGSASALTGVAFQDRDGDNFYDPGEGLSGVTVTIVNAAGASFHTTTMDAGGYGLQLAAGTYTVTFSGAGYNSFAQQVTISANNAKVDYRAAVSSGGGDDQITGTLQADVLSGLAGNDHIDGAAGRDTAVYRGPRSDYAIDQEGETILVVDSQGTRDGSDELLNIERLQFSDAVIAFDTAGNAGIMYRLYQAAFERAPDVPGLSYWVNQYDDQVGDLVWVANNFILSAEFAQTYGPPQTLSNSSFVDLLYDNVLGRAPDPGGEAYWLNQLANGLSRAHVLASFSESPENKALVEAAIANGILLDLSVA